MSAAAEAAQPTEALHSADQSNKLMSALLIAAIAASALSMLFSVGTAVASASSDAPQAQSTTE